MKEVILYTAIKKYVQTYDMHTIRQYFHQFNPIQVRNTDEMIDKQSVREINLPIERYCWNDERGYREIYAAFDEELLDIIGCSQEKFKRDIERKVTDTLAREYYGLLGIKDKYEKIQEMTFWQSLVWVIKRIKK